MIPQYPKFKDLGLDNFEILAGTLKTSERTICELAIANFYIWRDFDRAELTYINDNLCIRINPLNDSPYFLEPLTYNKIDDTLQICLGNAKKISRASEHFLTHINHDKYHTVCERSQFDYVYKTIDLAELKGKKFDGKRNHIRRFKKAFPDYQFTELSPKCKDIFPLFSKWFQARSESRYFPKLAFNAQKSALENACKHFKELGLLGGAIVYQDKLLGFMIGSQLNTNTLSAHFQYCHTDIQGITQTILQEACSNTFKDYEFINMEQDLGIPGLRTAKLSYHPYKIEKKYEITLKL